MRVALLVELNSGSDLRVGEIDNVIDIVREAIKNEEPLIDVKVTEFFVVPGPVDIFKG